MVTDDPIGYWVAGLIDGEGSFVIARSTSGSYDCRFQLALRDDDSETVWLARNIVGAGSVRPKKGRLTSKPQTIWCVRGNECIGLIEFLHRFPLRSRKRHDFELWEHAFATWKLRRTGSSWDPMANYAATLKALRSYPGA